MEPNTQQTNNHQQQNSPNSNSSQTQLQQNLMLWATLQQHQQLQILQAQSMLVRAQNGVNPMFEAQGGVNGVNTGLIVATPEKRSRTVFSMTQLEELEKVFRQQQYRLSKKIEKQF